MRVINLCRGAGNGVNEACLMTASNMLIGRGEEGDNNTCVCRFLRGFIIVTNDMMPSRLLSKLYGPLAWEILGTRSNDPDVMRERSRWAIDFLSEFAPGNPAVAYWLARAEKSLCFFNWAECGRQCGEAAVCVFRDEQWSKCPEIIRKVASIGDVRPVEVVLTEDEIAERLGAVV